MGFLPIVTLRAIPLSPFLATFGSAALLSDAIHPGFHTSRIAQLRHLHTIPTAAPFRCRLQISSLWLEFALRVSFFRHLRTKSIAGLPSTLLTPRRSD